MSDELPAGYGQVIYDGYRKRVKPFDLAPWGSLVPDDQECWNGAAADLAAYLDRIPR